MTSVRLYLNNKNKQISGRREISYMRKSYPETERVRRYLEIMDLGQHESHIIYESFIKNLIR